MFLFIVLSMIYNFGLILSTPLIGNKYGSMDSASAFFVTQTLRGLSRDGRTVIASIHQPSSEVFELFDRLYLLSGGKTVYFGKASEAYEVSLREVCCQIIFDFTNEL